MSTFSGAPDAEVIYRKASLLATKLHGARLHDDFRFYGAVIDAYQKEREYRQEASQEAAPARRARKDADVL